MREKLREKKWYSYGAAACIAVVLYVALMNLSTIWGGVRVLLGYFYPLFLGCVLAYLLNPLAKLFQRLLFRKIRNEKLGWTVSVALTVLVLLVFLVFLLGTLIPQMVASISMLVNNMDGYLASLHALTQRLGIAEMLNPDHLVDSSGDLMNRVLSVLKDNIADILNASVTAGRSLVSFIIALIVSVYLAADKVCGLKELTHTNGGRIACGSEK